jgi:hypothetical protein
VTVAPRMSNGALQGELVAREIDAIRGEAAEARGFWQRFHWGSLEPGFRIRALADDEWGRSESIDPDNVGDIADEGMGHRG